MSQILYENWNYAYKQHGLVTLVLEEVLFPYSLLLTR